MVEGIGIGFRRDIAVDLLELDREKQPDFIEIAPENWMKMGGYWRSVLDQAADKYRISCHGLSLSIGSPDPINTSFVKDLRRFLDDYQIDLYSEHLSYSQCENAHLYDLLPIPFRQDAIDHVADRIKAVQDLLGRPLILENVSYYTPVAAQIKEQDFIRAIIEQSGCKMLLDVNNVYVNAFNHNYDAHEFIQALPLNQVAYIHMAGHEKVAEDLIIDTHGQPIIDPVFELFEWTLPFLSPTPVLLERDFNIPELDELIAEASQLKSIAQKQWQNKIVN